MLQQLFIEGRSLASDHYKYKCQQVLGFVSDTDRRDAFLNVCRVLVEAGSNREIALDFFRSECFAASIQGLGDEHQDAALHSGAICHHPSVLSLHSRHLVSAFAYTQGSAQVAAGSAHDAHTAALRIQRTAHERRASAVREASEVLAIECNDAKIFELGVKERSGERESGDKGTAISTAHDGMGLAPHFAPHRRVQAVSVSVSWNDTSLRGIEFLYGIPLKDLLYYRL
jgi:hypothetical protein